MKFGWLLLQSLSPQHKSVVSNLEFVLFFNDGGFRRDQQINAAVSQLQSLSTLASFLWALLSVWVLLHFGLNQAFFSLQLHRTTTLNNPR